MDAHLDATPPSPAARARKTSTNTRIPRRIPQASSRLSRSVTLITPHKRLRSSGHARRLTTPPSPPPPPTTSTTPPPPRILRTRHLHPDPGRTPRLPLQDTGTTPPLPHKCEGLSDVTGYQRQRTRTPHTRGVQPRLGSEQPLCRVLPTYVTHPRPPKPPPPTTTSARTVSEQHQDICLSHERAAFPMRVGLFPHLMHDALGRPAFPPYVGVRRSQQGRHSRQLNLTTFEGGVMARPRASRAPTAVSPSTYP